MLRFRLSLAGYVTSLVEMNHADLLDTLKAQGIMDLKFINQAAQGVPQTFEPAPKSPRFPARTLSNGYLEIDLTGDDE